MTTWFVTGASRGLGREIVEQALERGERVVATLRHVEQLREVAEKYGDRLWTRALDVTDTGQIERVLAEAFEALGRIDVLVSNAGSGVFGAAEDLSDIQIERSIATNLTGSIQFARRAVPRLRAQGGGTLVQVSSQGGFFTFPGFAIYHATKFGLEGYFETLASEIAPFGMLTHLRVVVEIARRGSITAAATALGFTQSAISRQLRGAETAAGTVLFERGARGVQPTVQGEVLLRYAHQVLAQIDAAEYELTLLRGGLSGRLAVGAFPTATAHLVPDAVAALRRRHPAIAPLLTAAASPSLVRQVSAGILHVAVIAIGGNLPVYDLSVVRLHRLPPSRGTGIALASGHPLAGHDSIEVEELAEEPWVVGVGRDHEPQFGPWPTLIAPRIAFEAREWQTRIGLVAAGLGIAVVPGIAAPALPTGLVWKPVNDDACEGRRTVAITAPAASAGASAFVRAIRERMSEYAGRPVGQVPRRGGT